MDHDRPIVTVSIDTEEDNWGDYSPTGATTRNIPHLEELHERMARWGARPTYLVNRPPLIDARSIEVLGALAAREEVEVGAHCHPWNTPPLTDSDSEHSMMSSLPHEANRGKIDEVTRLLRQELGIRPRSFRAGRWGFGPTVAPALADAGYLVDASVSPFIDWRSEGGPDYTAAPHRPYRFRPEQPFHPDPDGAMVEIPTTVGFLRGGHRRGADIRRYLEQSFLGRLSAVGLLETTGLLRRRWLSPEHASEHELLQLTQACQRSGEPVLGLTFHSCTLLPGATPFIRDDHDRRRFLDAIDAVLSFAAESGFTFGTLTEVASTLATPAADGPLEDQVTAP